MNRMQIAQWADFNRVETSTKKENLPGIFILGMICGALIVLLFFSIQGCKTYKSNTYWGKPATVGRSEVYKVPYWGWYQNNTPIRLEDIE